MQRDVQGVLQVGFDFTLNLAHRASHETEGHVNCNLHGHSYAICLIFAGSIDAVSGYLVDSEDVYKIIREIEEVCSGKIMNDIPGMGYSMETLAVWIAGEVFQRGGAKLAAVEIRRPSCHMYCRFDIIAPGDTSLL